MIKPRKKRSAIWLMPEGDFRNLVAKSMTIGDVLKFFGLPEAGNSWKAVAKRCVEQEIDTSHFDGSKKKAIANARRTIPLEIAMVENSTYTRKPLKARLLKLGFIQNKCEICGLDGVWNGKPLVMRLDHKNGVRNDNRRTNLRMVCPNCDSQLDTFSGLNRKRVKLNNCEGCGKLLRDRRNTRCRKCENKNRSSNDRLCKIVWPPLDQLLLEIEQSSYTAVGKRLGVSDVAVHRRLKKFIGESSNGKTEGFGPSYVGSTPTSPTMRMSYSG